MGSRGPARTPTQILSLRGSWLAKTREGEPKGDPAVPHCPKWLRKEGKALWKEIVPQLAAMGVLARCDRNAIGRYCQVYAKWREAEEFLKEHGTVYPEKDATGRVVVLREYPQVQQAMKLAEQLLRLEREFGLTPSARSNIVVPRKDFGDPSKDRFFGR